MLLLPAAAGLDHGGSGRGHAGDDGGVAGVGQDGGEVVDGQELLATAARRLQPCSRATGCRHQDHHHCHLPEAPSQDTSLTAGWLYEDGGEGGRR